MTQLLVNAIVLCLAAHMIGDYVIQTDWMALTKTSSWPVALLHGATYTIPFVAVIPLLGASWWALLPIGGTHALIDRYYLAKHLVWAKNQMAPKAWRPPHTHTGHGLDRPDWIAVWLMIIVDNTLHMALNVVSVVWL